MSTVTIANQTMQSIFMPTAAGGMIALRGGPQGGLTFGVQQSDWTAWYADGKWLPGLASGAIYATVNT
jgi:hypothetical protein